MATICPSYPHGREFLDNLVKTANRTESAREAFDFLISTSERLGISPESLILATLVTTVPFKPLKTGSDVKGTQSLVGNNSEAKDYWEFDEVKHEWVLLRIRPRKRLYAPAGKDCHFDSNEVEPERITEWRCKGRVSVHRDNWQETSYQRIRI